MPKIITILSLALSLVITPVSGVFAAQSAGELLLKCPDRPEVYLTYVGSDTRVKTHIPSEDMFYANGYSFSDVVTISCISLDSYQTQAKVWRYPSGTLVQVAGSLKVYEVSTNGGYGVVHYTLQHIKNEKVAAAIFGAGWVSKIRPLTNDEFAHLYELEIPDASAIKPLVATFDDGVVDSQLMNYRTALPATYKVTSETAHSGKYSLLVPNTVDFSCTGSELLADNEKTPIYNDGSHPSAPCQNNIGYYIQSKFAAQTPLKLEACMKYVGTGSPVTVSYGYSHPNIDAPSSRIVNDVSVGQNWTCISTSFKPTAWMNAGLWFGNLPAGGKLYIDDLKVVEDIK